MKYKRFGSKIVVRLEKGDEILTKLKELCTKEKITLASLYGIGATNDCTLSLFEAETKTYHKKQLKGDYEIIPIAGNITTQNGEPYLHIHINLGDKANKSYSGHLNSAIISVTCEIFIDIIDGKIERFKDDETGINLMGL